MLLRQGLISCRCVNSATKVRPQTICRNMRMPNYMSTCVQVCYLCPGVLSVSGCAISVCYLKCESRKKLFVYITRIYPCVQENFSILIHNSTLCRVNCIKMLSLVAWMSLLFRYFSVCFSPNKSKFWTFYFTRFWTLGHERNFQTAVNFFCWNFDVSSTSRYCNIVTDIKCPDSFPSSCPYVITRRN